jgi:hypothetical protein
MLLATYKRALYYWLQLPDGHCILAPYFSVSTALPYSCTLLIDFFMQWFRLFYMIFSIFIGVSLNQIDHLKKKRDAITARIKLVKNREARQNRKDDIRRKILVGAYYLDQIKNDADFDQLVKQLDKFLVRDSERKLFNLPPISKE